MPRYPVVCHRCGLDHFVKASDIVRGRHKFCSRACRSAARWSSWASIWSRIVPVESGCWEWQGARDAKGYGLTSQGLAHRVSFAALLGPIPEGLWILHRCDNPPCCNPFHLYAGDVRDNVRDCVERNRHVAPRAHLNARVLTWEDVDEMKRLRARGLTHCEIAEVFGIANSGVSRILAGKMWNEAWRP